MEKETEFDLVVIGSGPAGEKGAAQAAYFGKKVALIEKEPVWGGAAANTGTLPSKTLRETALILSGSKARQLHGIDLSLRQQATVRDFLMRVHVITDVERERISFNLERHRIATFKGTASFVDTHTVQIAPLGSEPLKVRGKTILIASGSKPLHKGPLPFYDPRVYDSDTILNLNHLPKKLLVVGAGVIGSEYASLFSVLGVQVVLIDGRETLLGFLDGEISAALKSRLQKQGIQILMPDSVVSSETRPEGIVLKLASGTEVSGDALLAAAGRSSNTEDLHLEAAGLKIGKGGLLEVNEHYQTAVPHIYAAGDVIGFPALASTSMEQARLAMVHAFDLKYKTQLAPLLPIGVFTIPEVSMVGQTEEALKKAGVDYVAGRANYQQNARGQIIGDAEGFLKLIFRREDMKLLGVHLIGELATELIHTGLTAMLMNGGADLFIQTCYNYPSLGELYKYATYSAMGNRNK